MAPASNVQRPTTAADVLIAGAGIIGCAIAYELSRRGVSCVVLDSRRIGMAATNAAAGVLAPLAEFTRPGPLVRLGLESLRRYPAWVDRLREDVPDIDVEFTPNGVLRVAFSEDELSAIRAGAPVARELGMELVELDQSALRDAEPRLSEGLIGGALCPEEGQINQQLFTLALSPNATVASRACARRRASSRANTSCSQPGHGRGRSRTSSVSMSRRHPYAGRCSRSVG
jgi:glycine oxidase